MRKKIMFTMLISFFASGILAQKIYIKRVPEVQHDHRLDSLLDKIVRYADAKESCISIYIYGTKSGHCEFILSGLRTSLSVIDLHNKATKHRFDVPVFRDNLRYFIYKNILIFVSGTKGPNDFFIKTGRDRTFRFLDKKNRDESTDTSTFAIDKYDYQDGKLIYWDSPVS